MADQTHTRVTIADYLDPSGDVINAVTLQRNNGLKSAAAFTPAATSHNAGDSVGGALEFTNIAPRGGGNVIITSASLAILGGTAEASAFRLYLYDVTPPSATADDAAWDLPSGDRASFLGYVDLGTPVDLGSTCWIETSGINKQVKAASSSLFGYLVNLTTVSTAAVAHTVTLHTVAV